MAVQALVVVGALVALFLVVVATRPAKFRIERSITITAPPENAFGWSPWEKLDPDLKRTYEGATTFSFEPDPEGTKVTWAMDGANNDFSAKASSLFRSMDKLVGRDFERGLAALKGLAEKG